MVKVVLVTISSTSFRQTFFRKPSGEEGCGGDRVAGAVDTAAGDPARFRVYHLDVDLKAPPYRGDRSRHRVFHPFHFSGPRCFRCLEQGLPQSLLLNQSLDLIAGHDAEFPEIDQLAAQFVGDEDAFLLRHAGQCKTQHGDARQLLG